MEIKNVRKQILSVLFNNYQNLNQEEKKNIHRISISNFRDKKTALLDDININENDDFSKKITEKLEGIKNNTLEKIENLMTTFKLSYEEYIKKISRYIIQKEVNLSKINIENINDETILKYVVNNIFKNLNDINEVYDNIINNIEDNYKFLSEFLQKNELINLKNIKENFLKTYHKDIIKCSILSKFNFKEIDLSQITKISYYNNYLNYLKDEKYEGLVRTFTLKQGEMKKGMFFIKENFSFLQTLNIQGIEANEFKTIIKNMADNSAKYDNINVLKKLIIKDFDLGEINDKLNQVKLKKIKKIKIFSGQCLNPIYLSEFLLKETKCLISLSLEKINMTDYGLKKLMQIFQKNPVFLDTLEYLSLAGNCISKVKNDLFEPEEMRNKNFNKLIQFNLYKNNIYKFEIPLAKMPALKLLDLSSNNILTGAIMENMIKVKDKIVLFNDNIFITNNYNNANIYIDYLNKQLPKLDFSLKVLHLGFTYTKEKLDVLEQLKLSSVIKISLIKLDLSFCGLKTDILINFLKNNYGLFSLKKLNLKYNNIDNEIFTKLNCDEILLENINTIDLSENNIACLKFQSNENLVKLIKKYHNLEMIKLLNSKYFESWIENISRKNDTDSKFNNLFQDLKSFLRKNNRRFLFVINEENSSAFNENDFQDLFSFRFII